MDEKIKRTLLYVASRLKILYYYPNVAVILSITCRGTNETHGREKKKWNKSEEWRIIAFDYNRSREIDPYLPIESFLRSNTPWMSLICVRASVNDQSSDRFGKETRDEFVEVAVDHSRIQISAGGHTPSRLSILHLNQVILVVACI